MKKLIVERVQTDTSAVIGLGKREKKAAAGFEPANNGFANRLPKNVTTDEPKGCEPAKTQLTPQLTPNSQKQVQIDTPNLPPDLAEIVAVWPELPEHIKAAIKALVQIHDK